MDGGEGHAASTYRSAGVDIEAAREVKRRIKDLAAPTCGPEVLSGVGGFGALYELSGYREPVLVSSTDGVGTKTKLGVAMDRYETLGEDVVAACVNDVIVSGARPIYFMDYIGVGKLEPRAVEELLAGMARACEAVGCALIGGETAQMPGVYRNEELDLVGFAVGVVEKEEILDPQDIRAGDVLVGLPSSGLHTNGFSLVRSVFGLDVDPSPLWEYRPELGRTLGEALLEPHRSYYQVVRQVSGLVKSMAHITGGGLVENVPRALPDGAAARFDSGAWEGPPIFPLVQARGEISREEMYRVFNMGLGMVLVCEPSRADEIAARLPEARVVGEVTRGEGDRRVML